MGKLCFNDWIRLKRVSEWFCRHQSRTYMLELRFAVATDGEKKEYKETDQDNA